MNRSNVNTMSSLRAERDLLGGDAALFDRRCRFAGNSCALSGNFDDYARGIAQACTDEL